LFSADEDEEVLDYTPLLVTSNEKAFQTLQGKISLFV
jgi:hypothetical protein